MLPKPFNLPSYWHKVINPPPNFCFIYKQLVKGKKKFAYQCHISDGIDYMSDGRKKSYTFLLCINERILTQNSLLLNHQSLCFTILNSMIVFPIKFPLKLAFFANFNFVNVRRKCNAVLLLF